MKRSALLITFLFLPFVAQANEVGGKAVVVQLTNPTYKGMRFAWGSYNNSGDTTLFACKAALDGKINPAYGIYTTSMQYDEIPAQTGSSAEMFWTVNGSDLEVMQVTGEYAAYSLRQVTCTGFAP